MNRTAAMTVIRTKGNVGQTIVNGVVNNEHQRQLKRIKAQHAREIAKLKKEIEFQKWYISDLEQCRRSNLERNLKRYKKQLVKGNRTIISKIASVIGIERR